MKLLHYAKTRIFRGSFYKTIFGKSKLDIFKMSIFNERCHFFSEINQIYNMKVPTSGNFCKKCPQTDILK